MYTPESAQIYDALYTFLDYDTASAKLHELVQERSPGARSLLDVGCGTGRHLEALSAWYEVEGLDVNEHLLTVARARCPEVPLHVGDMTGFSLGRKFDVVCCLFSSIAYVRSAEGLRSALRAMRSHLAPGGVIVIEPWFSPESFWTGTITVNHVDEPERKITWMYTSDVVNGLAVLDTHYLVGTPEGIDHLQERHELGLFTEAEYLGAIEAVGLRAGHREEGLLVERGLYLGEDR